MCYGTAFWIENCRQIQNGGDCRQHTLKLGCSSSDVSKFMSILQSDSLNLIQMRCLNRLHIRADLTSNYD